MRDGNLIIALNCWVNFKNVGERGHIGEKNKQHEIFIRLQGNNGKGM